jgi:hypothetical protein
MAQDNQKHSFLDQWSDALARRPWVVVGAVALLLAIQITPQFKMSPDGVSYMSMARSLALHGRMLRLSSPHLRYAPAYPVFISPAFRLGSNSFLGVQALQLLYSLAWLAGIYAWFSRYAGNRALWVAALPLVSAAYWDLYRTASSEIVFSPALIWTGVCLCNAMAGVSTSRRLAWLFAAVVLGSISCATRQAGVMIAPGFCVAVFVLAVQKKIPWPRAIVLGLIFAGCIVIVSYGLIAFDHYGARQVKSHDIGYLNIFSQSLNHLPTQLAEGLRRQIGEIGRLLIPGLFKTHSREHQYFDAINFVYLAACVPVVIGWWRFVRSSADPLALMLPFYFALCVIYPYDSGTRFSVPLLPILFGCLWFFLEPFNVNRGTILFMLAAVHAGVAIGFWLSDAAQVRRRYQPWPEIERVAGVIPADADVIAFRGLMDNDDRWMFLMWLTDKPIAPEKAGEPLSAEANCIVDRKTAAVFPGFSRVAIAGNYQVEQALK